MSRFKYYHWTLIVLLFLAGWFIIGCDEAQAPIMNVIEDIVNDVSESTIPMYTYIGFRPSDDTLTPINPADEWDGGQDTIWERTRDGFYYTKHLLLDDWELKASGRPNRHNSEFEHWIYAVASSKVIYDLSGGDYSRFDGYVGLMEDYDACGHGGTVEFIFGIDGIGVWRSGKLIGIRDTEPVYVEFNIPADAQNLTIIVTDGGDGTCSDHWTIGNARLTMGVTDDVIVSTDVPESTTLIGFKPADDTLTPINPADEWSGGQDTIWERTRDGFYYTKHLLLDDWELKASGRPNRHNSEFEHWIYAVASSKIIYDLSGGDYSRFDGYVGLMEDYDACGHGGTVEFIFGIDGIGVWRSGKLIGIRDTEPVYVEFNIPTDAQNLTIIVTDGGDGTCSDHWTIGNARLTMGVTDDVIVSTDVPESTTLIGFKPADDTLTPINPADEWNGRQDTIQERTRDGFYYTKHLLLDDWELKAKLPLNRHDAEFEHWIYAHASSKLVYNLEGGDYSKFSGDLGLTWDYDACGHGGTVEFIFDINGTGVWKSGKVVGIRDTKPIHVEFDIPADAQTLTIIVTDGGDSTNCDHWTIGNAHLTHR